MTKIMPDVPMTAQEVQSHWFVAPEISQSTLRFVECIDTYVKAQALSEFVPTG
jgi:hypothetical protein